MQAPRRACVPAVSGLDEGQQVGVDLILVRGREAVPRKVDDDCLRELRWLYDRRDLAEARRDLAAWLAKWQATSPKLCGWVGEQIEETLTFYRLPRQHHKHLKSTNLLERLNEEIKRRTTSCASSPMPRAAYG